MYIVYPVNLGFLVDLPESMNSTGRFIFSWIAYLLLVVLSIRYLKGYFAIINKYLLILGGMTTIAIYGSQNISHIDFFKAFTYWIMLSLHVYIFKIDLRKV
jgi:hypothetical protein